MLSEIRYEELEVGQRWGPFAERLERAASEQLRTHGDATDGAPAGALPLLSLRALRHALDGIPPGGILARQRFTVVEPLPAEAELSIEVRVTDQRPSRSGLVTTFAFTVLHAGTVAAIAEWTIIAP